MELIAGVDEAGRGPLAGPVVASAVILPENHNIEGLKDSKKLSKKKRAILFDIIQENALSIGIGKIDEKIIDKINIREATFKAMQMALENLNLKPDRALIDGYQLNNQIIPNIGIIGGDNIEDSIKAASIIAKVTRDKIMTDYSIIFPEYGFEKHSGYGTKFHLLALDNYKATPIHRRTFKPVKKRMPTMKWLIDNDRINWMCEKLAALHLIGMGMEIIEINKNQSHFMNINIIANDNNQIVYINVLNGEQKEQNRFSKFLIKKQLKKFNNFLKESSKNSPKFNPPRFDIISVKLQPRREPDIQYLIDIK